MFLKILLYKAVLLALLLNRPLNLFTFSASEALSTMEIRYIVHLEHSPLVSTQDKLYNVLLCHGNNSHWMDPRIVTAVFSLFLFASVTQCF